jgi:hypothetical protein
MRLCNLFDKYRDGELSRIERRDFEAHLIECDGCRAKMSFLDNLAFVLKQDRAVMPVDLSARIAYKAFHRHETWDALVIGWLRPGPAFAALALVCALFSALWFIPNYQPTNAYSEYEMLIDEANAIYQETGISQIQSHADLIVWLEQEARSQ